MILGKVHRNRALEGDVVAVEALPESAKEGKDSSSKALGKVVGIIRRQTRDYVATLEEGASGRNVLAVPLGPHRS